MRRNQRSNLNKKVMTGVMAMAIVVLLICFLFLSMVSCTGNTQTFRVEGTVDGGADSTLTLEALTLDGIQTCSTCKIGKDGSFSFTVERADSILSPDFYRLRLGTQIINFVVDSLEDITVAAPADAFGTRYEIGGNEASKTMKTMALLNIQLQMQLSQLEHADTLSALEKMEAAAQMVKRYKQTLAREYILKDPSSASAYFALFQSVGQQMLYDPESDPTDVQMFAAVATQWDQEYPRATRTEHIRNIAIRGLRNTRQSQPVKIELSGDKVHESGIIDMGFPDINGQERRLSELKDYVVLLDFTSYSLPHSQQRNIDLRTLYQKYHSQGLEIYQVSVDADIHYWKTMCEKLPWVCVHCAEGPNADMLQLYQVTQLPSFFIIAKGSNLEARGEYISDLETTIKSLLK
ncbi:MAG: redoxin domain-containing protein [Bacteroidaceae bacterium]|nr:redoxin domain-containing protein [Bacteroidaceae bacterium]